MSYVLIQGDEHIRCDNGAKISTSWSLLNGEEDSKIMPKKPNPMLINFIWIIIHR